MIWRLTAARHCAPCWGLNRSILPFSRLHNLALSGTWELPFGKGKSWARSGAGAAVLGGWRLNSLAAFMSGLPFSVSASGTSLNMPGATQRANQVKPSVQIIGDIGNGRSWFDPLAFAPVTTVGFGNAGFYSLRGPGAVSTDLSVSRDFRLKGRTERFKPQYAGAGSFSVLSLLGAIPMALDHV